MGSIWMNPSRRCCQDRDRVTDGDGVVGGAAVDIILFQEIIAREYVDREFDNNEGRELEGDLTEEEGDMYFADDVQRGVAVNHRCSVLGWFNFEIQVDGFPQ